MRYNRIVVESSVRSKAAKKLRGQDRAKSNSVSTMIAAQHELPQIDALIATSFQDCGLVLLKLQLIYWEIFSSLVIEFHGTLLQNGKNFRNGRGATRSASFSEKGIC
jgi:hypothetical protein